MSVRALISKHSFAPAEARGDSDNPLALQKDALAYADAEITIRVTISYYGFLYVKPGGQCGGNRPCQFHVFINGANKVVVNTKKKWTSWQARLIKEAGKTVRFQTTPVNASGQPKVARRRRPASEESASEDSASEDSDSDGDSDEIERLKQKLAEQKKKLAEQKKKFEKKLNKKLDEQKKEFEKKFEKELNKKFEKELKEKLDEQKEKLKEKVRGPYEDLQVKLKNCMDKKSDQSDLALENKKLRQKIRKLLTVFHRLKDKVDATVKRM